MTEGKEKGVGGRYRNAPDAQACLKTSHRRRHVQARRAASLRSTCRRRGGAGGYSAGVLPVVTLVRTC